MAAQTMERTHTEAARRIEPRRGLPGGRAVVGGFLVALAAVGVFAAHRRAEAPPTTSFVVLDRALAPGDEVGEADVRLAAIDLPPAQAAVTYTDPSAVVDAVATHALAAGQLLTRTDVRETAGYTAPGEVSFPVAVSRALGGSLQAGERVDVLATFGTGPGAYTTTVVRDALVIHHGDATGFAGADTVDVRLGVGSRGEAMALAHAVTVADVFLVRAPQGEEGAPQVYRPPVPTDPSAPTASPGQASAGNSGDVRQQESAGDRS